MGWPMMARNIRQALLRHKIACFREGLDISAISAHMADMAKFIVDLTEDQRRDLEACRRKHDLKSHVATIRFLIAKELGKHEPIHVDGVQVGATKPKPGSMLKGAK
jgi:hypothetical protein